jgi:hypothetical protein
LYPDEELDRQHCMSVIAQTSPRIAANVADVLCTIFSIARYAEKGSICFGQFSWSFWSYGCWASAFILPAA